ncbi:MAG: helicase-exonuclease AddAB subunit AddA [Acutalibacteraceae bacterium]
MSDTRKKWTENQQKAIDARGMQILVSAAAGSGKTAVLTERVKNILSNTEEPCSVSNILVVTFTRSAAAEMKDRIYKALAKSVSLNSADNTDYLRRQMTLLPTADICTMDSFCTKIVRENFHLSNVGVDFKLLDDKDNISLMNEAVEKVVSDLYEENSDAFLSLSRMFLSERDDKTLCEIIKELYKYSRSYPSPFKWLDDVLDVFSPDKTPDESGLTDVVYKYLLLFTDYYIPKLNKCLSLIEESGGFDPRYFTRFEKICDNLMALRTACKNKNWDSVVSVINDGLIVKPYARNGKDADEELKNLAKALFKELEDDVENIIKRTLPTVEQHKSDNEILYPMVKVLCEAVKKLTVVLDEAKAELNSYSFDDILHKCIDLLVRYDENGVEHKTQLAKELSEHYTEILIDEYQDTNEAQNKIFEVISRNKSNMYVVGDVKQSIYRFRLASPNLFMDLKNSLSDYDGKNHPSKIILENNFRSRKGVTETVNYVFKKIMSTDVGEIDYNEREYLYYSALGYAEKETPDTDIICLDTSENEEITEPGVVARYILNTVNSGVEVKGEDGPRRVGYGDFCILLRSAKKKAKDYADELRKHNIPVNTSLDDEVSEFKEIQFLVSLVKVINNPMIDIPLISVMMSPIFGFTADELSEIRMIDRKCEFYTCLLEYSKSSKKAKDFLDKIQFYRNISVAYPIDEFIGFLVEDTAVSDIFYVAGEGENRVENVKGFIKLANDFVLTGRNGLNDFVKFMNNAIENGALKRVDNGASEQNSVKIMSVHKSKGLEFPYVIIADCSKRINRQDSTQCMTVARETGIGLKIRDDKLFTNYRTLSSVATENAVLFGEISEELRILYVAMTRAKEHLTFVCDIAGKTLKERVKINTVLSSGDDGKIHPFAVYNASSMTEWLLTAFASHKDCGYIREACGLKPFCLKEDGDFSVSVINGELLNENILIQTEEKNEALPNVNNELLYDLTERVNYEYPYDFSGVLAKRTASSTESTKKNKQYFASTKPKFLSDELSGAERGTAIHKFLERCDFKKVKENIDGEISSLLNSNKISQKEVDVLDKSAILSFINSSVGERLLSSSKVLKEYKFNIMKKVPELYENVPSYADDEEILVQGILDCAFFENDGAVLIDYKSDKSTDESYYVSTYKNQMDIYAEALEKCKEVKVKEKYIYSFILKKFILVR